VHRNSWLSSPLGQSNHLTSCLGTHVFGTIGALGKNGGVTGMISNGAFYFCKNQGSMSKNSLQVSSCCFFLRRQRLLHHSTGVRRRGERCQLVGHTGRGSVGPVKGSETYQHVPGNVDLPHDCGQRLQTSFRAGQHRCLCRGERRYIRQILPSQVSSKA